MSELPGDSLGTHLQALFAAGSCAGMSDGELLEQVHEEVSRLPERFRAPIVLCYLEGLTHDEAARRLGWPVGTVRSRLARAREALRPRLTRRHVTAPAVLGPLKSWLAGDLVITSAANASLPVASSTLLLREASHGLAHAASRLVAGQTPLTGSISATSLPLAQGLLTTMILKKLAIASGSLVLVVTAGLAGAAVALQDSQAQDQSPARKTSAQKTQPGPAAEARQPTEVDRLAQQLLDAARNRLAAQRAYYEEGRITIDRFMDACRQFELAELLCAKSDDERDAIKKRYLTQLKEIEDRERDAVRVGRGTVADASEATYRRQEAEFELKTGRDTDSILQRLRVLEKAVGELQRESAERKEVERLRRAAERLEPAPKK